MPLEYAPRTRSIYSDLGFILLGFLAADRGGARSRSIRSPSPTIWPRRSRSDCLRPPPARRRRRRPLTEDIRGADALLVGEVHDNYAAALGGVAGHAGLFGTAPAVGALRARRAAGRARRARRAAAVLAVARPPIHDASHRARQLARARLGHDAADLVVRHADVAGGVRPRRVHGHVALDRSRARPLFRAADQPRLRRRIARADARRRGARFTTRSGASQTARPSS